MKRSVPSITHAALLLLLVGPLTACSAWHTVTPDQLVPKDDRVVRTVHEDGTVTVFRGPAIDSTATAPNVVGESMLIGAGIGLGFGLLIAPPGACTSEGAFICHAIRLVTTGAGGFLGMIAGVVQGGS